MSTPSRTAAGTMSARRVHSLPTFVIPVTVASNDREYDVPPRSELRPRERTPTDME